MFMKSKFGLTSLAIVGLMLPMLGGCGQSHKEAPASNKSGTTAMVSAKSTNSAKSVTKPKVTVKHKNGMTIKQAAVPQHSVTTKTHHAKK